MSNLNGLNRLTTAGSNNPLGGVESIVIYEQFSGMGTIRSMMNPVSRRIVDSSITSLLWLDPIYYGMFAPGMATLNIKTKGNTQWDISLSLNGRGMAQDEIRKLELLTKTSLVLVRLYGMAQNEYFFLGDTESQFKIKEQTFNANNIKTNTVHNIDWYCNSPIYPPVGVVPFLNNDASRRFTFTVDTSITGSTSSTQFRFAAYGTYTLACTKTGGYTEWFNDLTDAQTISFAQGTGIYTIEVYRRGATPFHRLSYFGIDDVKKITSIISFGAVQWSTCEYAFAGAINLNFGAVHAPDLSLCTSTNGMFYNCAILNANFSHWNMSNIEDATAMFYNCTALNADFSAWNTSSLILAEYMFYGCALLNSDFSNWKTPALYSANNMFTGCINQAKPIHWDSATEGSITLTNINSAFKNLKVTSIKLQAGNISTLDSNTFNGLTFLTELILEGMETSFEIHTCTALLGTAINNLANSVATVTTRTVKMTIGQKASCDNSLWTSKGWIIIT